MPNEQELQAEHGVPTELPPALHAPCSQCPWRREAWAGYLGPMNAENWAKLAQSDMPVMCHQTIEESGNYEGTFQCKGAAIFRANICKEPRRHDAAVGPQDKEIVFASTKEFEDHHKGEPMTKEYEGFKHEQPVTYIGEDNEDECVYNGEEGHVEVEDVGAAKYGNEATVLYFRPKGCDEGMCQVDPLDLEPREVFS
jgi:hypothetical protein